jgi:Response regulator containing a CheY-like receiver domain and a GGDEF domain
MAIEGVRREPPDLILLDINMPEMNGYEVCQKLKASVATAQIPIVFISALERLEDKVRAFDLGGVDYITKTLSRTGSAAPSQESITHPTATPRTHRKKINV